MTETYDITVSESVIEELIEMYENRVNRIDNVLNSFRSNELTDLGNHYRDLTHEKEYLVEQIEEFQELIEDNEDKEPESSPDLGELFG